VNCFCRCSSRRFGDGWINGGVAAAHNFHRKGTPGKDQGETHCEGRLVDLMIIRGLSAGHGRCGAEKLLKMLKPKQANASYEWVHYTIFFLPVHSEGVV